ncbi:MAG: hypothetical protein SFY95_10565 [Planctomycetota bacterium]|nr:hypothetical protein [Planctomycetota bacterium]
MDMLMKLWLAILAAGAGAWVWGFLSYAVLGVHGGDSKKLPAEESLLAEIKRAGIPPGEYQFPWVEKAQQKDPEVQRKWKEGPVGQINLWGPFSIPRNMLATFVVNLAVAFLTAYIGAETLPAGSGFSKVFQVLGTVGVLAYGASSLPNMIWFQARAPRWRSHLIDTLILGLGTAAIFAAMWPQA